MSQDTKELRVRPQEPTKRVMYLIKEFLLYAETVDVVSGTSGASSVASAAEALVRLKYVTYSDIRTETYINEQGGRRTKFLVRLKKAPQFQKLYDENEAVRKQKGLERQGTPQETNTNDQGEKKTKQ